MRTRMRTTSQGGLWYQVCFCTLQRITRDSGYLFTYCNTLGIGLPTTPKEFTASSNTEIPGSIDSSLGPLGQRNIKAQ